MRKLMFAGTASSSGKTTVCCGIMKALCMRGMSVASFKCGPDYIDPMFHEKVVGTHSGNLDGFFCQPDVARKLFQKHSEGHDISILEGVMGYFDGIGFTRKASSYEMAVITDTPVILVVNARGMANSLTALIRGFLDSEEKNQKKIRGVILNRMPKSLYPEAKREIEALRKELKCYGYVPYAREFEIADRHLGLVTPQEIGNLEAQLEVIAEQMEKTVDIDGLLDLSQAEEGGNSGRQPALPQEGIRVHRAGQPALPQAEEWENSGHFRLAVAKDAAFSFLYRDNLEWLKERGAQIVYFSPLQDRTLPENCRGLILSGGYPELYREELGNNQSMRTSIREAIRNGLPTIAECGGFLYLQKELDGSAMAGFFDGRGWDAGKLVRFGYIYLTAKKDGLLANAGEKMTAHEFHHWDVTDPGADFYARKASGAGSWPCAFMTETLYAGFPHIFLPGNERAGEKFVRACLHTPGD